MGLGTNKNLEKQYEKVAQRLMSEISPTKGRDELNFNA